MHFKKIHKLKIPLVVLTIGKAYMNIADDTAIPNIDSKMKLLEHPDLDVGTLIGTPALCS